MKKLLYLFLVLPLIFSSCKKEDENTNTPNINPTSGLIGYLTGNFNKFKTTDGGITWTPIQQETAITFDKGSSSFPAESFGFFVTDGYGAYKTIDGGVNWTTMISEPFEFSSVDFPSISIGYIYNDNWEIFHKTTNWGDSWQTINLYTEIELISFPSNDIGLGHNGTELYKTTDGGKSWAIIHEGEEDIETISFL